MPILIFEPVHEPPRNVVVESGSPRPGENGGMREGLRGDEMPEPEIDREGCAEPVAEGLLDQPQP